MTLASTPPLTAAALLEQLAPAPTLTTPLPTTPALAAQEFFRLATAEQYMPMSRYGMNQRTLLAVNRMRSAGGLPLITIANMLGAVEKGWRFDANLIHMLVRSTVDKDGIWQKASDDDADRVMALAVGDHGSVLAGRMVATPIAPTGAYQSTVSGRSRTSQSVPKRGALARVAVSVQDVASTTASMPMPIRVTMARDELAQPLVFGVLPQISLLPFTRMMQYADTVKVSGSPSPIFNDDGISLTGLDYAGGDKYLLRSMAKLAFPTETGLDLALDKAGDSTSPRGRIQNGIGAGTRYAGAGVWASQQWRVSKEEWPCDDEAAGYAMNRMADHIATPDARVVKLVQDTVHALGHVMPRTRTRQTARTVNDSGRGSLRVGRIVNGSMDKLFIGPSPTRAADKPPAVTVLLPIGGCPACDSLFCNHSSGEELSQALVANLAAIQWACEHKVSVRVLATMTIQWQSLGWTNDIGAATSALGPTPALVHKGAGGSYDHEVVTTELQTGALSATLPTVHVAVELKSFREAMSDEVLKRMVAVCCNSYVTRPLFGQLFELVSPLPQFGNVRAATMRVGDLGPMAQAVGGGGTLVALDPTGGKQEYGSWTSAALAALQEATVHHTRMAIAKILSAADLDAELLDK